MAHTSDQPDQIAFNILPNRRYRERGVDMQVLLVKARIMGKEKEGRAPATIYIALASLESELFKSSNNCISRFFIQP